MIVMIFFLLASHTCMHAHIKDTGLKVLSFFIFIGRFYKFSKPSHSHKLTIH